MGFRVNKKIELMILLMLAISGVVSDDRLLASQAQTSSQVMAGHGAMTQTQANGQAEQTNYVAQIQVQQQVQQSNGGVMTEKTAQAQTTRLLASQGQAQGQTANSPGTTIQVENQAATQVTPAAGQIEVQAQGQATNGSGSQGETQGQGQNTNGSGTSANQGQGQGQSGNGPQFQGEGSVQVVFQPNGHVAVQGQQQQQVSMGGNQAQGQGQGVTTHG